MDFLKLYFMTKAFVAFDDFIYLFYERVLCVMRKRSDFWFLLLLFLLFVAFLRVSINGTVEFVLAFTY
jgi:hypothetical protein